jgi:hypothetical protein
MAINPQIPALGLPPVEHIPDLREVPAIIRGERPMRTKRQAHAPFADSWAASWIPAAPMKPTSAADTKAR